MISDRFEAVTLDATGTLIHCPRLGQIYSEVLTRHGHPVGASQAQELVYRVWRELDCVSGGEIDRFSTHQEGAKGFWRRLLGRVCEHLEGPPPSRFAAAELFDRFGRAEAWEIYPDALIALAELRQARMRMAVVANWDERLPALLHQLGLATAFETIVTSQSVRSEKPHPAIFQAALGVLGLEPERVVHVGDRPLEDIEGAEAIGMEARLVDRPRGATLDRIVAAL